VPEAPGIKVRAEFPIEAMPKRLMSTLDGVMLFAQSQPCEMHFMNQRTCRAGNGNVLEIKALPSVEGLTHRVECRESHPPDTDSRLLTQLNDGRICSRRNLALKQRVQSREPRVFTGPSDALFRRQYNDGGWRAHVTEPR
jgi:hypothetical protein